MVFVQNYQIFSYSVDMYSLLIAFSSTRTVTSQRPVVVFGGLHSPKKQQKHPGNTASEALMSGSGTLRVPWFRDRAEAGGG